MPKLFVVGDSFVAPPNDNHPRVWPQQVADRLGCDLENWAEVGTAQDWSWQILQYWFDRGDITADDYLIVALTHPNRFWYLQDNPKLTNPDIIDMERWCSPEQRRAIEYFLRYIQRPALDIIHINNRLGYLAYQIGRLGLRRPLMLKCFDFDISQAESFWELNWTNGIMMNDVQRLEFDPVDLDENITAFWHGIDARYNHLCLSNHDIMADKVAEALTSNTTLDLTSGFIQGLLKPGSLDDDDLAHRELNMEVVQYNRQQRDNKSKSWIGKFKRA